VGSGSPFHFHQPAFNVLAHGRKQWLMQPPWQAFTSTWPPSLSSQSRGAAPGLTDIIESPLECFQESGDVMVVPALWAHATLNLDESIGVAFEVAIPGDTLQAVQVWRES
jgi:ribosomal protein L16 Arg81 hydroxylase